MCLLIGNILLIATISAIPMYAEAIMQRIFVKELENIQINTGRYPGQAVVAVKPSQISADLGAAELERLTLLLNASDISRDFDADVISINRMRATRDLELSFGRKKVEVKLQTIDDLAAGEGLDAFMVLLDGAYPSAEVQSGNVIEALATEEIFQNMLLNEVYSIKGLSFKGGNDYKVKIVGVARATGDAVSRLGNALYVDSALFDSIFMSGTRYRSIESIQWNVNLDYHQFRVYKLDTVEAAVEKYSALGDGKHYSFTARFASVSEPFPDKQSKLNLSLWVLEVPIFILLAFFISMVARQILTLDRNEISVMKSRGATRPQIFVIYLLMNSILELASLIAGIPIGMAVCSVLGASNGFLELVNRAGLQLRLQPFALLAAAATALASTAVCVLPSLKFSKITIVAHKREKAHSKTPLWQKLFIDVLLLAAALYEFYNFSTHIDALNSGGSVDPMLFLSSSVFVLGAGLLFVRLINYLIHLIFFIGRKLWNPSVYASFLKVIRSSGEEQFIMLFLILTLATGVFNAKIARTINLNNEDAIRYTIGADAVIKELWQIDTRKSVSEIGPTGDIQYKEIVYEEPDFTRYSRAPEVTAATKVFHNESGTANFSGNAVDNISIYGVVSDEFGRVAQLRGDLLPYHFYEYLNALAVNPEAILVSADFRDKYELKIGSRINYSADGLAYSGVICGFVDFWPGYDPTYYKTDMKGVTVAEPRPLIIANLNEMQRKRGVQPYEVWMRTNGEPIRSLYEYAETGQVKYRVFKDLYASLIEAKNEPVFQGTNGVLTIGFLIILLVCAVGFLIYWILSIRSRELQFGIFRAMGLTMGNLISMLLCEQVLISGTSIAAGIGIGILAGELFVPLIQVGYATGTHLPLIVASEPGDFVRLMTITGAILIICIFVLGTIIRRLKIAQALKLGED
ncbi:MAG: ABC transporter permease [Oscillospiraceae bacterium]|nr:ABC transporter permease [Oscillospiraceae bacterium]